jgi:hypothetical protein
MQEYGQVPDMLLRVSYNLDSAFKKIQRYENIANFDKFRNELREDIEKGEKALNDLKAIQPAGEFTPAPVESPQASPEVTEEPVPPEQPLVEEQ